MKASLSYGVKVVDESQILDGSDHKEEKEFLLGEYQRINFKEKGDLIERIIFFGELQISQSW